MKQTTEQQEIIQKHEEANKEITTERQHKYSGTSMSVNSNGIAIDANQSLTRCEIVSNIMTEES